MGHLLGNEALTAGRAENFGAQGDHDRNVKRKAAKPHRKGRQQQRFKQNDKQSTGTVHGSIVAQRAFLIQTVRVIYARHRRCSLELKLPRAINGNVILILESISRVPGAHDRSLGNFASFGSM